MQLTDRKADCTIWEDQIIQSFGERDLKEKANCEVPIVAVYYASDTLSRENDPPGATKEKMGSEDH